MSMILIDEATVKLAMDYLNELIRGLKMDDESHAHQVSAALREALTSVPDWASEAKEQSAQPTVPQDIPDLIAGALGVSRGTAYDMMREALAQQPAPATELREQEPVPCCGKYEICTQACTPRGRFLGKREALAEQQAQRTWVSLKNEEIDLLINGRGDEDDEDYVEPTGDGFGLTDSDLVQLVRRSEAKLKEKNT